MLIIFLSFPIFWDRMFMITPIKQSSRVSPLVMYTAKLEFNGLFCGGYRPHAPVSLFEKARENLFANVVSCDLNINTAARLCRKFHLRNG